MEPGKVPGPDNLHPEFFYASAQSVPHMVLSTILFSICLSRKKGAQNLEIFESCCYPEAK